MKLATVILPILLIAGCNSMPRRGGSVIRVVIKDAKINGVSSLEVLSQLQDSLLETGRFLILERGEAAEIVARESCERRAMTRSLGFLTVSYTDRTEVVCQQILTLSEFGNVKTIFETNKSDQGLPNWKGATARLLNLVPTWELVRTETVGPRKKNNVLTPVTPSFVCCKPPSKPFV
jgi:hypothetical protein